MHPDATIAESAMKITEDRPSIVKEFEWAITDLQNVVEELHGQLIPVTKNEPIPDMAVTDVVATSEARSRLHDLQGTTALLRSLISRLEV